MPENWASSARRPTKDTGARVASPARRHFTRQTRTGASRPSTETSLQGVAVDVSGHGTVEGVRRSRSLRLRPFPEDATQIHRTAGDGVFAACSSPVPLATTWPLAMRYMGHTRLRPRSLPRRDTAAWMSASPAPRAFRIVRMGDRCPEYRHNVVADVLVDAAPTVFDNAVNHSKIAYQATDGSLRRQACSTAA